MLWRLLRSRLGAAGTIVVTALVFGIIHPYGWQGIVQVSLGGVVFGLCREWRGSLIAPMTVHCLHNTTITLIPLLFYVVVD